MRYALDIAYDGARYSGWQVQPNANTVQAELNLALSTLLRRPMESMGAGRTDAGVHARQLIVHFDYDAPLPKQFLNSLNGILPYDIAIKQILIPKDPDFNARFTAISRAYTYHVVFRKSPFDHAYAMWVRQSISMALMNEAAQAMHDYDDFASFSKLHGGNKTSFCRIDQAYWQQEGEQLVFHVKADRFLRGMVRAMVGTLLLVGTQKIDAPAFRKIIEAKDRKYAGPNVPAKGLFLTEVAYPTGTFLHSNDIP